MWGTEEEPPVSTCPPSLKQTGLGTGSYLGSSPRKYKWGRRHETGQEEERASDELVISYCWTHPGLDVVGPFRGAVWSPPPSCPQRGWNSQGSYPLAPIPCGEEGAAGPQEGIACQPVATPSGAWGRPPTGYHLGLLKTLQVSGTAHCSWDGAAVKEDTEHFRAGTTPQSFCFFMNVTPASQGTWQGQVGRGSITPHHANPPCGGWFQDELVLDIPPSSFLTSNMPAFIYLL